MILKGPYHNIKMFLGNNLVLCDWYGLFLHSGCFSVRRVEVLLSYFAIKKSPFSRSQNVILVL